VATALEQHQLRDGPPSSLVVVKVHEIPDVATFLEEAFVPGIQEIAAEPEPVFQVVTAPSPLPSFRRGALLAEHVAVAFREVPRGARLGDGVHHARARDGVQERRLFRASLESGLKG